MRAIVFMILVFTALSCAVPAQSKESFEIKILKEDKTGIWVAVETSLPDHVEIRVSLSRAIVTIRDKKIVSDKGITVERTPEKTWYSYFSVREQVSQWRKHRLITMDNIKWRRDLKKHMDKRSAIGAAFEVKTITDEIELSAYAYKNKTGEPYEKRQYKTRTEKLFGTRIGLKSEILISRPWKNMDTFAEEASIVNAYFLEVDRTYRLIKPRTPITQTRQSKNLDELTEMFEGLQYLPAGTVIRVLEVVGHKESKPYYPPPHYRVSLPESPSVRGWIYSTALSPDGVRLVEDETNERSVTIDRNPGPKSGAREI